MKESIKCTYKISYSVMGQNWRKNQKTTNAVSNEIDESRLPKIYFKVKIPPVHILKIFIARLQNDLICLSKTHKKDLRGKRFYDKAFVLCLNSRLVAFDKIIVKQRYN